MKTIDLDGFRQLCEEIVRANPRTTIHPVLVLIYALERGEVGKADLAELIVGDRARGVPHKSIKLLEEMDYVRVEKAAERTGRDSPKMLVKPTPKAMHLLKPIPRVLGAAKRPT